jgi:hypothetical protein
MKKDILLPPGEIGKIANQYISYINSVDVNICILHISNFINSLYMTIIHNVYNIHLLPATVDESEEDLDVVEETAQQVDWRFIHELLLFRNT